MGRDHRGADADHRVLRQNVTYPGINTEWGFWVSSLVIVVASVALWWSFRRRGWL